MKLRLLLMSVLMITMAYAAEDSVRFVRSFKQGDVDKFKAKMSMSWNGADAEIEMEYKQTVAKVFENQEADVETSFTKLKFSVAGQLMSTELPASIIQRFSKAGVPIGGPKGGQGQMMSIDYSKLIGAIMDKMFTISKEYAVEWSDPKDAKNRIKGTVKVESVVKGIAKLLGNYNVWNEKTAEKPINVALTMMMDVASSKPNKLEGVMSNIPAMAGTLQIDNFKFSVERTKK